MTNNHNDWSQEILEKAQKHRLDMVLGEIKKLSPNNLAIVISEANKQQKEMRG
jgi:hypothetical protein